MKTKSLFSRRFLLSLLGLSLLVFLSWLMLLYVKSFAKPVEEAPPILRQNGRLIVPETSPLRRLLTIESVSAQVVAAPFTLPAIVVADPATMMRVLPPLLGRINTLNKRLGDSVKAGDILFTINSPELAQAMSDLEKSQAALLFAKQNLSRQQRLTASNIAAQHDIQQAQNDYDQAASEFARANARLIELRVDLTDTTNQHILTVRSPISGHVVDLSAAVGEYRNDPTAPIMTVADLSKVFVTASAQEKDLAHIFVGQNVAIHLDAYTEMLKTKVDYIGAVLSPETRTVDVRMVFDNAAGLLKPNMFAKAYFIAKPHQSIVLPLTTVIQRGFDSIVFVEVAPWQFEPRLLKLGVQFNDKVEVVSGLKPKERVVVRGGIILND